MFITEITAQDRTVDTAKTIGPRLKQSTTRTWLRVLCLKLSTKSHIKMAYKNATLTVPNRASKTTMLLSDDGVMMKKKQKAGTVEW